MILKNCLFFILRSLRPWRPFDLAQDMLCGRYSEFHLWLYRARTLAMVINRISYQQRETLHLAMAVY
jgi:hypothetical protein